MKKTLSPTSRTPLFCGLSPAVCETIHEHLFERTCGPQETIFAPEDPADMVCWIDDGRVKVFRLSADGRELTFRHLYPGDIFGEECMVPHECRRTCAQSLDTTVLLCMSATHFRDLLSREIEFTLAITMHSCRRAREIESIFSETIFRPVRGRIAAGLLRLHQQKDPDEQAIHITHQEVANLVGTTRETTTSVLQSFRKAGVLEMANRRVTVLKPDALRQLVHQP